MYESGRDPASTPGSNHEILPASVFSSELDDRRLSVSSFSYSEYVEDKLSTKRKNMFGVYICYTTSLDQKNSEFRVAFLQYAWCFMAIAMLLTQQNTHPKNFMDPFIYTPLNMYIIQQAATYL